jgi:UDP-3-O-[3-hydroxymyristoyl] glucosamine N-acyltransferase
MPLTAGEVARLVRGELIGPETAPLDGVAPLERAGPTELAFLEGSRYLQRLRGSHAGAVLIAGSFRDAPAGPATRIIVPHVREALFHVLALLYPRPVPQWGIHPTARVERGVRWKGHIAVGPYAVLEREVRLGADCVIGPYAVIGSGARLGSGCRIAAHALLHPGVVVGARVVVHAGARVGGEGFGFVAGQRLPQVGRCVIADDVEIGANTTIDRGGVDDTVIGQGTKIDNLVQIAHNVRIGAHCVIMSQVGIAGSTVLEDDVTLAGQAGLAGHLTVHRGARVAAQSGVIGDIAPGSTVSGYPARPHREVLRQAAVTRRLTPLVQRLERMAHDDCPA